MGLWILAVLLLAWGGMGAWQRVKPLPDGVGVAFPERPAERVRFLADRTWYDAEGRRHLDQAIFDEALALIGQARRLVVADMFLFNDFAGSAAGEAFRPLSAQLTQALIDQKRDYPELDAVVITDPLNTLYGGLALDHFERLRQAGVRVVETDLTRLRASNPLWSGLWHLGPRWLGNRADGGWLPNVLGPGRVTLRSYLDLLNFNANHRKTLVVDRGEKWAGLVTSANPHDASSLHGNVALAFQGAAALDLLASERSVAAWSGITLPGPASAPASPSPSEGARMQLLTEGAIRDALLDAISASDPDDRLDVAVFYLAHRGVIEALEQARNRGVRVRVLLDPNRGAFGIEKGGIPNRPVALELHRQGVEVRWCVTQGEQCHTKLLLRRPAGGGQGELILGSANFTRRNLDNLNLETSVRLVGPADTPALQEAGAFFDERWNSSPGRVTSEPFGAFDKASLWQRLRYRVMEATGLSTF
ncbi:MULTISPECIES: phospholipase D family protein [unclassified Halomonas]|uniref:phospholipase D family protein n=1 Tax=unclassified Halomonas TaxID=2609666 RepID=UPI0028881A41|nr:MULTISPECIES: phospholipase D family protein [unclassified Halomonas]MDT0501257.1 phospholipase D family protein [Halomonas sp. PAR7]MDT0511363.1 phospholipase D family protein [Halomonas sp. LES1]MDT0590349.1 phospholipase D family protein [Halomonas sp. PAR8]